MFALLLDEKPDAGSLLGVFAYRSVAEQHAMSLRQEYGEMKMRILPLPFDDLVDGYMPTDDSLRRRARRHLN